MEKQKYNFKTPPYEHQRKALELGWSKESFAYFMEMGTGKTKVLIDNLGVLFSQNLINAGLIIAPKSVYTIWQNDELPKHLNVPYNSILWKPTLKEKNIKEFIEKDIDQLKLLVMNVEAFSTKKGLKFAEDFVKKHHCLMSIDESTAIKNNKAIRTKNILKLRKIAKYRRILTGSPITKNPLDLYTQCYFLDPNHLGFKSLYAFKNYHCHFEIMHFGDREIATPVGFKNLEEIENKLPNFSFRVTKEECLDLPKKLYTVRYVQLTDEQKKLYDQIESEARANLQQNEMTVNNVLTEILRLHQITAGFFTGDSGTVELKNNKLNTLMEVVESIEGKAIIWANWVHNIEQIKEELIKEYGVNSTVTFYGKVTSEQRTEAIKQFHNNPECRFFVANPSTGGYGLTLTQATTVIYYSNSYNAEHRMQSEERAHRIGQTEKVTYVDLITEDTVDEKIVKALKTKFRLSAQTLGEVVRTWI